MEKLREYLNREYMQRLNALTLKINNQSNAGYAGMRKSLAKGASQEFSDFRDYAPGDDIRRIDWNGYGRFDRLFVKLFSDEKQAAVNIFLDKSASMDYGEVNKLVFAKLLTASLSYITLNNADKVNIFCWDDKLSIPRGAQNKNMFPRIVDFLDGTEPGGGSTAARCVKNTAGYDLGGGVSFIISDFFSDDGYEEAVKYLQSKKQDIVLIQVLSKEEAEPELYEGVRLFDSESAVHKDIYITGDVLKKYNEALKAFRQSISDYCAKRGARYIYAPTDAQPLSILSRLIYA